MIIVRRPACAKLFPYTTLFRSALKFVQREARRGNTYHGIVMDPPKFGRGSSGEVWDFFKRMPELLRACRAILANRSEEHTSELQSRENLVCRLLLEKKKKRYHP